MSGMDRSLGYKSKTSIEFLLNSKAHGSPSSTPSDSEHPSVCNQAPFRSDQRGTSHKCPVSNPGQSAEETAQAKKGTVIHHCPHCPKEMVCKNAMEYHKLRVHHDKTADIIQFPCTFGNGCREVMGRKEHFDSHMDQHRNPSPSFKYICQVCGIRFMQPSSLKRHHGWGHDTKRELQAKKR